MQQANSRLAARAQKAPAEPLDVLGAIREKLASEHSRIVDLLHEWDDDKSGEPGRTRRVV